MDDAFAENRNSECPPFTEICWRHFQLCPQSKIQNGMIHQTVPSASIYFRFMFKTDYHASLRADCSVCV